MKREELFEGAIVLARRCKSEKRRRCKVVSLGSGILIVVEFQYGLRALVYIDDIRPAKITRKSLKECGFVEYECYACKTRCLYYKGTRVRILLKDCRCGFKIRNIIMVPWQHKDPVYMHEVQKEIKKLGL